MSTRGRYFCSITSTYLPAFLVDDETLRLPPVWVWHLQLLNILKHSVWGVPEGGGAHQSDLFGLLEIKQTRLNIGAACKQKW